MKKNSFYSKASIFVYSVLLTGVVGALMVGYNLRKTGKKRIVFPLVLITLLTNIILHLIIKSLYRPNRSRQWNLNKTIGWDGDFQNYLWWVDNIFPFYLSNIIIGFILVSFVWQKQLSESQTYERMKPWIPFIAAVVLYTSMLIILFIPDI